MTDKIEDKVVGERGGCIRSIIPRDIRMTELRWRECEEVTTSLVWNL